MDIGILIPTTGEARGIIAALKMKRTAAGEFTYEAPNLRVVLQICGIGADNARRQAETLLNRGTEFLVLAGFCGGLTENLRQGDLVIDNQRHDPHFANTLMRIAVTRNIPFHLGTIHTSPRFLAKPEEKIRAGIHAAAIAVDMESAGVLDLCRARNLPFRSFRTVSDGLNQPLPSALQYETFTLRFWCALACLLWEWPSLCRAFMSARLAKNNLSVILADWVRGLPKDQRPPEAAKDV